MTIDNKDGRSEQERNVRTTTHSRIESRMSVRERFLNDSFDNFLDSSDEEDNKK